MLHLIMNLFKNETIIIKLSTNKHLTIRKDYFLIGKSQSGKDAIKGITGRYQAGFFPIMMFGIPAAALAMYHTAKTTQKNKFTVGS